MLVQQEKECLELDNKNNETNEECRFETKEKYFDEWDLDSVSEEKELLRSIFDGVMNCDCHLRTEVN